MTGQPPAPPPKWKTATVTLLAVFPPVLFFNIAVVPYLGGFPLVLRTLALCVGVTAAVTWVMMPRLMPLVKNWLNASTGRPAPSEAPRDWADDGTARPAWLLDAAPIERVRDPGPRYDPRYDAPREAAPQRGGRRTPWYGRQPEDDYPTVEFQPEPTRRFVRFEPYEPPYEPAYERDDYREDDYYEEPARYRRYRG